jgi:hypothetical protein
MGKENEGRPQEVMADPIPNPNSSEQDRAVLDPSEYARQLQGSDAFVFTPTLPEVIVETAPEVVAETSTFMATIMAPIVGFFFPSPIGTEPTFDPAAKFDFGVPVMDPVTITGRNAVNIPPPPPPLDNGPPVIGFPGDPPNWFDIASGNDLGPFGAPEFPGTRHPLVLFPVGPEVPYGKPREFNPPGIGPDPRPTGAPGIVPFLNPLVEFPLPRGLPDTRRTVTPSPDVAPNPYADPGLDPFRDPFAKPAPAVKPRPGTSPRPGTRVGTPTRTVTANPTNPFVSPFNPFSGQPGVGPTQADPLAVTSPETDAQSDPCNCAKVKEKPKTKKKKKPRTKCYEYRNRQFSDGIKRVQTIEVPCEPRGTKFTPVTKTIPKSVSHLGGF